MALALASPIPEIEVSKLASAVFIFTSPASSLLSLSFKASSLLEILPVSFPGSIILAWSKTHKLLSHH